MERITLRQWRDSDLELYAAMNADPEVMRYFPSPLSRRQSEDSLARQRSLIEQRGWGLWALDVDGAFAGFTGLAIPSFEAPFMPCVEVGWRLRREYWGQGVAYRAALQALEYGFSILKLAEIVSFTAAVNAPSRRLMERLHFAHDAVNDFEHPSIPEGHELRHHVLYRKNARLSVERMSGPARCLAMRESLEGRSSLTFAFDKKGMTENEQHEGCPLFHSARNERGVADPHRLVITRLA